MKEKRQGLHMCAHTLYTLMIQTVYILEKNKFIDHAKNQVGWITFDMISKHISLRTLQEDRIDVFQNYINPYVANQRDFWCVKCSRQAQKYE